MQFEWFFKSSPWPWYGVFLEGLEVNYVRRCFATQPREVIAEEQLGIFMVCFSLGKNSVF